MKQRDVVTSFLFDGEKVILLKRSDKVSTFKNQWGAVSGSVDPGFTPFKQALKEIFEETGIPEHRVLLLSRGEPFELVDEKHGFLWRVHPFIFGIKKDEKISLNFEHQSYKKVYPHEIPQMNTVQQLYRGWENCVNSDGLKKQIDRSLMEIKNNTNDGARTLAKNGVKLISSYIFFKNFESDNRVLQNSDSVIQFAKKISKLRPSMKTIENTMLLYLYEILEKGKNYIEGGIDIIEYFFTASKKIKEKFGVFLKDVAPASPATLSFSQTVLDCLVENKDKIKEAFVFESSPLKEGLESAKKLCENGIKVKYFVDAAMGFAVNFFDFALFGADCILSNGGVVNKIGSYPLSLVARQNRKKVVCIAERIKVSSFSTFEPEFFDSSEITDFSGKNFEVLNPYFEVVPADLIDFYITEEGIVKKDDLKPMVPFSFLKKIDWIKETGV